MSSPPLPRGKSYLTDSFQHSSNNNTSLICVFIKECSNGFSKSKVHKLGFDWELLKQRGSMRNHCTRRQLERISNQHTTTTSSKEDEEKI
ncbi:hypothetical protein P8452_52108 [Trifolium repens]|nr:hypothetical protein P8452_52108 [Trifolium repens]